MFQYAFVQKAFIAGILVSITTALLGVILVQKKLSLLGDGLSHAAFGGMAIGLLFNINPLLSALTVAIIASIGIEKILDKIKSQGDAAIAVILSTGMAIAITIIGLIRGFNVNLFSFLFGSILSINNFDLMLLIVLSVLVIGTILIFRKQILFLILNKELAELNGVDTKKINYTIMILSALTVILAVRAVGILLVTGVIVMPALAALQISKSFSDTYKKTIAISLFGMVGGIMLAILFDLPPSGIIILTMTAILLITFFLKK